MAGHGATDVQALDAEASPLHAQEALVAAGSVTSRFLRSRDRGSRCTSLISRRKGMRQVHRSHSRCAQRCSPDCGEMGTSPGQSSAGRRPAKAQDGAPKVGARTPTSGGAAGKAAAVGPSDDRTGDCLGSAPAARCSRCGGRTSTSSRGCSRCARRFTMARSTLRKHAGPRRLDARRRRHSRRRIVHNCSPSRRGRRANSLKRLVHPARLAHARAERSEVRRERETAGCGHPNEVGLVRPARLELATSWFVAGNDGVSRTLRRLAVSCWDRT